jgi:hypothetical protein
LVHLWSFFWGSSPSNHFGVAYFIQWNVVFHGNSYYVANRIPIPEILRWPNWPIFEFGPTVVFPSLKPPQKYGMAWLDKATRLGGASEVPVTKCVTGLSGWFSLTSISPSGYVKIAIENGYL